LTTTTASGRPTLSITTTVMTWSWGATSSSGLAVGAGDGAWVSLLVFEEDGSDVVDGDVDGVGDTRDGKDALQVRRVTGF
jgi:hypothetical protein